MTLTSPGVRPLRWMLVAAVVLAGSLAVMSAILGSKAVGGSDSFGYASQADLLLHGHMFLDFSFARDVPWPAPRMSFTPLGYMSAGQSRPWAAVPAYAPGLSLLFAAAKTLGGQTALFLVVPLSAGLLVFATYGIGARLGSSVTGLVAAWLVATSPTVLYMTMVPMSDVPAAAAWAMSFYAWLGTSTVSALAAGFFATLAILIRPNLVPLAALFLLWPLAASAEPRAWRRALVRSAAFIAACAPGVLVIAAENWYLFGSPLTSSYGKLSYVFVPARILPNLDHYARWIVQSETPFIFVGLAALVIPLRRLWPGVPDRRVLAVMALSLVTIWVIYFGWLVFDAWWYLRFLLPSWPFLMLGTGAVLAAFIRSRRPALRVAAVAVVIGLGVFGATFAASHGVFTLRIGEDRYAAAGLMVRRVTPPNSVIVSFQHSGSVRYYGGRVSLRYDIFDPAWIDRAVTWFADRGVHTYLLVEDWEIADIRDRFPGTRFAAAVDRPPIAISELAGSVNLFDLTDPPEVGAPPTLVAGAAPRFTAVPPTPLPRLRLGS